AGDSCNILCTIQTNVISLSASSSFELISFFCTSAHLTSFNSFVISSYLQHTHSFYSSIFIGLVYRLIDSFTLFRKGSHFSMFIFEIVSVHFLLLISNQSVHSSK